MPEGLVIDSTAESASNVQVDLFASPFSVKEFRTPTPPLQPRWAEPADADGEALAASRYQNREITIDVEIVPSPGTRPTSATVAAQAALASLADKVAKVNREGGTLRRTLPSGDVFTFDLLAADSLDPSWDVEWDLASALKVTLKFTAKPFARGTEVSYSSHSETTLPVLIFTETGPDGDVPALGRLVLTDASGNDQQWAVWGLQSRYYDPAATAALFYEAETRTPMGTAAVATVTGASGGASRNAVTEGGLTSFWAAVLSTQTSGGGAHVTHVGDYRVFARLFRPTTNTGAVSVGFEWALSDFRSPSRNGSLTYGAGELEGVFTIADLGLIYIPRAATRWEGRILARSTAPGDDLSVDCLWLVPAERSGEVSPSLPSAVVPSAFTAFDGFAQSAGALAGKTLPTGGTWSGAGDADDFRTQGAPTNTLVRAATTDGGSPDLGRYAIPSGSAGMTRQAAAVDVRIERPWNTGTFGQGLVLRYTNPSNCLLLYLASTAAGGVEAVVSKVVAGAQTVLTLDGQDFPQTVPALTPTGSWARLAAAVYPDGAFSFALGMADQLPTYSFAGFDSALATGGSLASGSAAIFDWNTTGFAASYYDNFACWVPPADAACFANQSLQVGSDGVTREDITGTFTGPVAREAGDRLLIPAAGAEGRAVRVVAKLSRGYPDGSPDGGIDDLSGQLMVTPRYLAVA